MNKLKMLRKEKGLTVRELGKAINISYAAISKMENNHQNINNDYLQILSDYFNVSTDYLLGLSDIRNPEKEIKKLEESDPIFFSLYEEVKELSLEQKEDVLNAVKIITKNIKNKNN